MFQAGITPEQMTKLKEYRGACEKETGVDTHLIEEAKKGTFNDDPKLKSFLVCLAKKIGFIGENGEIQHDVLKTKIGATFGNQENSDKLDAACAVKKATVEDTVFESLKCYYEKTGKPILFT